jgi:hypothetical protein
MGIAPKVKTWFHKGARAGALRLANQRNAFVETGLPNIVTMYRHNASN